MGQCQTKNKKGKSIKKPKFCVREEYFVKNGGNLLEKEIALSHGRDNGAGHLKILSHKDIKKATHNFDPSLLVGSSTHRNVYEGIIEDRRVAIKASPPLLEPNLKLIDRCSTEAATALVMNHKNMAKLVTCMKKAAAKVSIHPAGFYLDDPLSLGLFIKGPYQMGQTLTKSKLKNKRKPKFDSREEYFIKNGGILLGKQVALSQGHLKGAGQLKIFSSKDIEKATTNYTLTHSCGTAHHFILYRASIDDRSVAIKAPSEPEPKPELVDLSLTAASTVMVMNHENIIKLYGCCLETFVPILVYEFPHCANLFYYLHGNIAYNKRGITWIDRLRVATGTAYALSYMHTALSKPVVHRNVKSLSVFFDGSFHAILANFGYSVAITPGKKTSGWPIEGTPGYLDPEYVETREVTDKCDVYSFGVLLLELLTGRPPCVMAENGIDLVSVFVSMVERNCMMKIIDNEVLSQASRDEIQRVAQLVLKCVAYKGEQRPTMVEVVEELWLIKKSKR